MHNESQMWILHWDIHQRRSKHINPSERDEPLQHLHICVQGKKKEKEEAKECCFCVAGSTLWLFLVPVMALYVMWLRAYSMGNKPPLHALGNTASVTIATPSIIMQGGGGGEGINWFIIEWGAAPSLLPVHVYSLCLPASIIDICAGPLTAPERRNLPGLLHWKISQLLPKKTKTTAQIKNTWENKRTEKVEQQAPPLDQLAQNEAIHEVECVECDSSWLKTGAGRSWLQGKACFDSPPKHSACRHRGGWRTLFEEGKEEDKCAL